MCRYRIVNFLLILFFCTVTEVFAEEKPQPIQLPQQTPLSSPSIDENNLPFSRLPDGTPVYNVFEIAMQAMEGREWRNYLSKEYSGEGLIPRLERPQKGLADKYKLSAINWIEENGSPVGQGGLIWYYKFPNTYNDITIHPPWGSAFGQAYVLKALLHFYQQTGEYKYKELIDKAIIPYGLGIKSGGLQSRLKDGNVFFEEIPTIPAAHILNGHMISCATLFQLHATLNNDRALKLAQEGIKTLKSHLDSYDLGDWSSYDMNYIKGEIIFRLRPSDSSSDKAIFIDRISLTDPLTDKQTILDVGAQDDAVGAWRISGTEWLSIENIDDTTVRSIDIGAQKHCAPVRGGSLQNSYIVLQLPEVRVEQYGFERSFNLKVDYFDNRPGRISIEIKDNNHGNFMHFKSLRKNEIITTGSKQWKVAYIPVSRRDLAWYMGPVYQTFHVKLLDQLYKYSEDDFFKRYADIWGGYLAMHSEVNYEKFLTLRNDCPEDKEIE